MTSKQTTNCELMGVAEAAEYLGVSTQLIAMWMKRGKMPKPAATLRMGTIWWTKDIIALEVNGFD